MKTLRTEREIMTEEKNWRDIRDLTIEGRAWNDTESYYDRFPARAKGVVRDPVWNLSLHSAGICARFATDADSIDARWSLRSESLAMDHMPATGVSGLDLYVRADDGQWRWLGVGRPTEFPTNTVSLVSGLPREQREYLLYLPLYNGVTSVEIAVPADATIEPGPPRPPGRDKPIVFYGTSITQGGCASRPGMVHTALLGRWLDCPIVNLGFSGNGTMDTTVADLLAEMDVAIYAIDCLPNMNPEQVAERTVPLVQIIRQKRPETPIVLVEDRTATNAAVHKARIQHHSAMRAALSGAYDELVAAGDRNLHYLPGEPFMGDDGEATVDGSHPTDLGFQRQASCFLPLLNLILDGDSPTAHSASH
ncbi:MAG: hypothetical protein HOC74_32260 [Gemmatimonadetes bacterium]|nr:hypothetical protein [Gemmatimonadota bacterium]